MSDLVTALKGVLTKGDLLLDGDATGRLAGIWRSDNIRARVIVRPTSTEEVAAVMKLCHDRGQHVVVHGGLTGLVHAADTDPDDVVISTERLNRIEELDTLGRTLTVQAGVPLQSIHEAASAAGLMFPVDLGARGSCQIGGNVSTNAGGLRVIRYGMTRDNVLGLEAVLSDGTIVSSMNRMLKNNSGYDLKQLFIGAEGTLGIITRAVLKLWPKPKDHATSWSAVPSPQAAVELLSGAYAASEDNVTSCELMGRQGIDLVLQHIPGTADPLADRHEWYVLMEWSSTRPPREGANESGLRAKMEAYLGEAMEKGLVLDAVIAQTEAQSKALWMLRENHTEASKREGPSIKHDISVAVSKIPPFVHEGLAAMTRALPGCRPLVFGHVGDGNLHFNCQAPAGWSKPEFMQYGEAISGAVYDLVTSYGGSISAEHGIGRIKVEELAHYRTKIELDVMRSLKRALDPDNLMNPGKVIQV